MLTEQSKALLRAVFGEQWGEATVAWWKFIPGTKEADDTTFRWARAKNANPPDDHAVYFSSALWGGDGKRGGGRPFLSAHAFAIDDVGTKVPEAVVADFVALMPPSWDLTSSKDNRQLIYGCPEGWTDDDRKALWAGMAKTLGVEKLDGDMQGQFFRLPQGVNGKDHEPGRRDFAVTGTASGKSYARGELMAFAVPVTANAKQARAPAGAPTKGKAPPFAVVEGWLRGPLKNTWDGDPNDIKARQWWVDVGHILKLEYGDEAFPLWVEWSGPNEPADNKSLLKRWQGFHPDGSIGWGTLERKIKELPGEASRRFDDDAGVLGIGVKDDPLTVEQLTVANWLRKTYGAVLRFNTDRKQWMEFDGDRWVLHPHKRAFELSMQWASSVLKKDRKAAANASFHDGVENMLRQSKGLHAVETDFDQDPWIAGVPGGTLELKTGRLRAGDARDMISKCMAVAPAAREDCPRWLKFVREITLGDAGMALFLKQWAGYCLTGDASREKLLFIYGGGGNGKSKYVDTLTAMLGDYGVLASKDVFIKKANPGHLAEIAKMAGSRMVSMTEVDADAKWNESLLKEAAGGGSMSARFMRQNEFTFPVTFKLTGYGNHKPTFPGGVSPAIRRRFIFAEFGFRPAVPDQTLAETFRKEMPGILRWAINGLTDASQGLLTIDLTVPQSMQDAANVYFAEADPLERWLLERTTRDAKAWTSTTDLFEDFNKWRIAANEHGYETMTAFGTALKDQKGFEPKRKNSGRGFKGLLLKSPTKGSGADAFDDELKP